MNKRELAQLTLVAFVGSGARIASAQFTQAAVLVCDLADALHTEMNKRAEAWHDAQPAPAERPGPWDPS